MLRLAIALLLALACFFATAQTIEETYPKSFKIPSDSFHVRFSRSGSLITMKAGNADTVDMGTDGEPGSKATLYFDKDSVVIPYKNMPYNQNHYFTVEMPGRKFTYYLHFNGVTAYFPPSYIQKNTGQVQFEIPQAYELANILWTLSPTGQRAKDLYRDHDYYQQVVNYFKPWMNHPIFKQLDFPDSLYFEKYYEFRENSVCYSFKGDKLAYAGPYYFVMGNDWENFTNTFKALVPLVEDFAKQSNYLKFYNNHNAFYATRIERMKLLTPVKNMWTWLEKEFPGKFQSYKIVFSPLIGGSHSTQQFTSLNNRQWFRETVMFVCGTDRYDARKELTDKQREGLMSGIVFTEIDHNYVNPVSYRHKKAIDSAFANRAIWAGDNTNWYGNPMAVFNEYMTHSLFCLWVMDNYDKATADFVIDEREKLMVERRKFIRFKEFNRELMTIREQNKDKRVVDLYIPIIEWCKRQQ